MSRFIMGPLVRMAGGNPVRVLALADALHREARGQRSWQHVQEGGGWLDPETGRWLTLCVLALFSLTVSFLIRTQATDQPWLACMILCLAQFGAVVVTVARDAVLLLLGDEDRRVIGWWPASERELVLARYCLLLRAMLQTTLAVAGLPLAVLIVHAPWPVVSGLGALIGLGLHTMALAALLVLGIRGLSRLMGLPRARRTIELFGVLTLLVLSGQAGADKLLGPILIVEELSTHWKMLALPVSWFAAWAALWPPAYPVLVAAGLGASVSCVAVFIGLRYLGAGNRGETDRPAADSRSRCDWARPVMVLLRPWFMGCEGRILTILLRAHLRRDWRLTSQLMFLPLLYLALVWRQLPRSVAPEQMDVLLATRAVVSIVLFMSLLGLLLGSALTYTSEPSAAWILRSGVFDGRRLLILHRRLLRVLVAIPFMLSAMLLLQLRMHLPWQVLLPAAASALLACELSVAVAQWIRPALPFSRAWRRNEQVGSGRVIWFLALIVPLGFIWLRLVLERSAWGWPLTVAMLLALLVLIDRLLRRRVAQCGLYGFMPQR